MIPSFLQESLLHYIKRMRAYEKGRIILSVVLIVLIGLGWTIQEEIAYKDSNGKWGFVNNDGKTVIEPKFDEAMSFSNGLAAVRSGDKWGFIDDSGELVIDYKYSDGGYFTNNGICFVGLSDEQMHMISLRF